MIWASREDRPAVRGRLVVLAVLMRPPWPTLVSVQEGATVCMLSTTTGHTARAKSPSKSASPNPPGAAHELMDVPKGLIDAAYRYIDTRIRGRRGGCYWVAAALEPEIRPFGSGVSVFRSLNSLSARLWSHCTATPSFGVWKSRLASGTVVVSGFRSANATCMRWEALVPWLAVRVFADPVAAGMIANGLSSTLGLVILLSSALMNSR